MSFKYKSQIVTLENYRTVFKVCSPDILDEIRSAVLDDTAIAPFISRCGADSYKLGQLRMAIREMIPVEFVNPLLTGKTIYNIRQGVSKGRDMSPLLRYFSTNELKLDAITIEKLSELCLVGTSIDKVDFTLVPSNLTDIIGKGLYQGYPMWLLLDEDGCHLDEETIRILMRGMSIGVDIHPFINGDWQNDILIWIFSYANSIDMNDILKYINSKFDMDSIKVLYNLAADNVPIAQLCIKDTDGNPIYNSYQMYELGLAIKEGVDTREMYNASLSDFEIAKLRNAELIKKNRKLSASLTKKN